MPVKLKTSLALVTALLVSLLGAGSASASLVPHGFINSFSGSGTNALLSPYGIAVDNSSGASSGDVYVTDTANYRVEKFDASGNFLLMFGENVNVGSGDPNVCTNAGPPTDVCQPGTKGSASGAPAGAFYNPIFVAVDGSMGLSSGDVYVADVDTKIVQKFDSSGNLITSWGGTPAAGQLTDNSMLGLTVDAGTGNLWTGLHKYAANGTPLTVSGGPTNGSSFGFGIDNAGRRYWVGDPCCNQAGRLVMDYITVSKFNGVRDLAVESTSGNVFSATGTVISRYQVNSSNQVVEPDSSTCTPVVGAGGCDPTETFGLGFLSGVRGLALSTSGNTYVADTSHHRIAVFGPATLPDLTNVQVTGGFVPNADVGGHVDLGGSSGIVDCYVEYWISIDDPSKAPCSADAFGTYPYTGPTDVHATLTGLSPAVTYHYQLVVTTSQGTNVSGDQTFIASGPPLISDEAVSNIHTDEALLTYKINPDGSATTYHVEYGTGDCAILVSDCTSSAGSDLGDGGSVQALSYKLSNLAPGSLYHYRIVAQNGRDTTTGPDHTLLTYAPSSGIDPCANAQVRKQTKAGLLLDCRAYELVSVANAGGYDVESDTEPGRQPLIAYPRATDRVLYSLHQGSIPGIAGSPTNYGRDPYIASRGADGWRTSYVGLPSDGMEQTGVFGSPLLGSDSSLDQFAFGGAGICDPCFADGSTNVPLRRPDGSIVKGMAGNLNPAAERAGVVRAPLSPDGSHFIFGSTAKFEDAANSSGTDVTIYDRDLEGGATQVISTMPDGSTIAAGAGVAELGVSSNGSRVLIGKLISTDAQGNPYYHLYMHIGTESHSVDLTPGTSSGVLYDGMSSDGTEVYFTTPDPLLAGTDADNSADIYAASVDSNSASLSLISKGSAAGNANSCTPDSNSDGPAWNNISGADNCDVVAFSGGAGVASGDGSIYFLSPEALDGNGTADAINLFIARPDSSPHFIATLEDDNPAIHDALYDSAAPTFADFQVAPSGDFAAFTSNRSLTGFPNFGHSEIYRYDAKADRLDCASCAPSRAAATSDTKLTPTGLNLIDDGHVFYTSLEPLVLRDTNNKRDAYEWEDGVVQLISSGTSPFDSGLLSASADGTDAFFFTRADLAPQDQNGATVKVYDARAGGGFLYDPPTAPCQASDECHGPGSAVPEGQSLGTFEGSGGNVNEPSSHHKKQRKTKKKHPRKRHRHRHAARRHGK